MAGGDGTVKACVGELAGTDVALAVLPAGTGNLLAVNLGLSDLVEDGIAIAVAGGRRWLDVGMVGEHCFVVMAGMGFDAKMIGATSERLSTWRSHMKRSIALPSPAPSSRSW